MPSSEAMVKKVFALTIILVLAMTSSMADAKEDEAEEEEDLPAGVEDFANLTYYKRPTTGFPPEFNPMIPKIGEVRTTDEFESQLQFKLHSVAFGVRVFKRLLDPLFRTLEYDSVSLEDRFPYRILPHDPNVLHYCRDSFLTCLDYLAEKFSQYNLTVHYDNVARIAGRLQGYCDDEKGEWSFCPSQKFVEGNFTVLTMNITEGVPQQIIRHYSFLLTSMQFMCWYTLNKIDYLRYMLYCDTTSYLGGNDGDKRADGKVRFNCALYSFCPNSCTYPKRRQTCTEEGSTGKCVLNFGQNKHFHHLLEYGLKTACECVDGYVYDHDMSCIQEYYHQLPKHTCDPETELSFYFPGGVECTCNLRYLWDFGQMKCIFNEILVDRFVELPSTWGYIWGELQVFINWRDPIEAAITFPGELAKVIYDTDFAKRYR